MAMTMAELTEALLSLECDDPLARMKDIILTMAGYLDYDDIDEIYGMYCHDEEYEEEVTHGSN